MSNILKPKISAKQLFFKTFSRNSNGILIVNPGTTYRRDEKDPNEYCSKMYEIINKSRGNFAVVLDDFNNTYPEFRSDTDLIIKKGDTLKINSLDIEGDWFNGEHINNHENGLKVGSIPFLFIKLLDTDKDYVIEPEEERLFKTYFSVPPLTTNFKLLLTKRNIYAYINKLEKLYNKNLLDIEESSIDLFVKTFETRQGTFIDKHGREKIKYNDRTHGYTMKYYYERMKKIIESKTETESDTKIESVMPIFNSYIKAQKILKKYRLFHEPPPEWAAFYTRYIKTLNGYIKDLSALYSKLDIYDSIFQKMNTLNDEKIEIRQMILNINNI